MKYEEIKIGSFYNVNGFKEEVIAKDRNIVTNEEWVVTIDDDGYSTTWYRSEFEYFEPIKEGPRKEETLELVSKASLDLSKFGVEIEQKGNVLIINPIKK